MKRLVFVWLAIMVVSVGLPARPAGAGTGTRPERRVQVTEEGFRTSDDVRKGFVVTETGATEEVTYSVVDGRAILEGDIDLGPAGQIPTTRREAFVRAQRTGAIMPSAVAIEGQSYRWPGGVVPYVVAPDLPARDRMTRL